MKKNKVYIDADGCPVVLIAIEIAHAYALDVVIVCDYAHEFQAEEHVDVIFCDKGKDSVDFEILRRVQKKDIVISQDYGLASLLLSKGVLVCSQNGLRFHDKNIDSLLAQRHFHQQLRKSDKHAPHMKKRVKEEDEAFKKAMIALCEEVGCG